MSLSDLPHHPPESDRRYRSALLQSPPTLQTEGRESKGETERGKSVPGYFAPLDMTFLLYIKNSTSNLHYNHLTYIIGCSQVRFVPGFDLNEEVVFHVLILK